MDNIQAESLEEKLKSLMGQLDAEHAVFERMVYKNKNQHRRCSYFQYLLKVRRDLRLLRTANMGDILRSCFHVITETKPRQKMHHLESLKWKRCDTGKPNLLERLLGAVRLLSQMTEIILKAASEISTLLARSFFIGFSVTFLALLARLRVLVQQILLDAVSVFNTVTSISRKKQTVKIAQDGIEVYREFYPKDEEYITLDCIWKTDKFLLLETLQKRKDITKEGDVAEDTSTRDASTRDFSIRYHTLVSLLEEGASSPVEADCDVAARESSSSIMEVPSSETNKGTWIEASEKTGDVAARESSSSIMEVLSSETKNGMWIEASEKTGDGSNFPVKPENTDADPVKPSSSASKVAFLSVKRPSPATCNAMEPPMKKPTTSVESKKEEDGFHNLLIRGTQKDSLF